MQFVQLMRFCVFLGYVANAGEYIRANWPLCWVLTLFFQFFSHKKNSSGLFDSNLIFPVKNEWMLSKSVARRSSPWNFKKNWLDVVCWTRSKRQNDFPFRHRQATNAIVRLKMMLQGLFSHLISMLFSHSCMLLLKNMWLFQANQNRTCSLEILLRVLSHKLEIMQRAQLEYE